MEPESKPEPRQEPPLATRVVYEQARTAPPAKSRLVIRLLMVFVIFGLVGSLFLNLLLFGLFSLGRFDSDGQVVEKFFSHTRGAENKVAIISVEGAILGGEGFVKRQIDRAAKDENVKAVVLRVNSPGGTITGSDYIYHHLRELARNKGPEFPIVVSMGGIAASGGYYVSMAVGDKPRVIFAEPTTWTGSIGVIIPHYDLQGLMEDLGIKEDSVASGPLKKMGSFARPMTEEELKIFKELVEEGFEHFKDVIKQGRPGFKRDPEKLDKLATGQIYTAKQAEKNGLVDKIGFIEDAIDRAINLARLSPQEVQVVRYKREPSLAAILLGGSSANRPSELARLLQMATPRAYYLCTWLPPLAGTQ